MHTPTTRSAHRGLIVLAFIAFIALGLPDGRIGAGIITRRVGGTALVLTGLLGLFARHFSLEVIPPSLLIVYAVLVWLCILSMRPRPIPVAEHTR